MRKYVVSGSMDEADWNNSVVVKPDELVDTVTKLREEPGGDVLVNGSAQLVEALRANDLVDEYRLMVFPTVLGAGKRLFAGDGDASAAAADRRQAGGRVADPRLRAREGRAVIELTPIGRVESELTDRASAPKQGLEGAPDAWLVFEPAVLDGLDGIAAGRRGDRPHLAAPRSARRPARAPARRSVANPLTGRLQHALADRPNPIGLHPVEVVAVEGARVRVRGLEAVDGTPIVDVKPVLQRRLDT